MTTAVEELMHCPRCGKYFHIYVRSEERLNPDTWRCMYCNEQAELIQWID